MVQSQSYPSIFIPDPCPNRNEELGLLVPVTVSVESVPSQRRSKKGALRWG